MTDSPNEKRAGIEEIETNLGVLTVSARDSEDGRKTSPKVRRKSSRANFGVKFKGLGVAAQDGVFRSGTSASRRTPACIYM
jgi:hypothetical protein